MAASDASPSLAAASAAEAAAIVAESAYPLQPVAGGTKTPAACGENRRNRLNLTALNGVVDYRPSEFTITVRAATPLGDLDAVLAAEGQFLPFDPPRLGARSTIGGTVAAGVSGPCRLRYGGVRDFVLAVEGVDGLGNVFRGGCPVVKNSAGFDLPKLLVGSWGSLAVITELALKVFPRPQCYRSVRIACPRLESASQQIFDLARSPLEIDALDLLPPATVLVRVAGDPTQAVSLAERVCTQSSYHGEVVEGAEEAELWNFLENPLSERQDQLIRVPLAAESLSALDQQLSALDGTRRYCAANNVAWLWLDDAAQLSEVSQTLRRLRLRGRVVHGTAAQCLVGNHSTNVFAERVRAAFDPGGKFFHPQYNATSPS